MKFTKMLTLAIILSFVFNMAPISNAAVSSGGIIGQWQNVTPLPSARMDFALVRSNANIYLVGGCITDCFEGPTQSVEKASILSNGDLGAWQGVNQLTTRRQGAAAVIAGNYLYALGGFDGQGLSSVERAPINADGTLGSWNTMQSMSISRSRFNTVVVEDYLYAIGGFSYERNSSGEALETVERARIEADGTLSAWQPAPSLNVGRSEFVAFQANGYLYVLGGETQQNGYWISSDIIERASINLDGSIGAWQSVGIMPVGRHSFAAEYVAGDLYVMGGNTAGNPGIFHNSVDKTQVRPDGSIGSWQSMPAMITARYLHGAAVVGGYLYAIGGYSQSNGGLRSIEGASLILTLTAEPPEIEAARDLGALSQPPSVLGRGGGATALVGGQVLWTFSGSLLNPLAEDGARSRSSMAALGDPNSPLALTEPLDATGAPVEFLPFTEEERAYNESGREDHYTLTPVSVVDAGDGSALVFYNIAKLGPSFFDIEEMGTGIARVEAGSTTAVRDPELLFTAPEPSFDHALVFQSDVYLYACYKDGPLSPCRVARAPLDRASERAAYRFWNGKAWVADVGQAVPAIDGIVASGLSVSWNPYLDQFLAVYSGVFSNHVFLRTSPRPEGPWSEPVEAFTGMPPADPNAFNSGAREHPELASNGGRTVVISYFHPLGAFKGRMRLVEVTFR